MKYFELKQELNELYKLIEENGIEDYKDTFESLIIELEDKVRFFYQLLTNSSNKIEFYKSIVNKYSDLIAKEKKNIEFAEDRLLDVYENFGEVDIKDDEGLPLFKVKCRFSEAVVIKDISTLDEKYIRTKYSLEPDKMLIKQSIKDGTLKENDEVFIEKRKNIYIK